MCNRFDFDNCISFIGSWFLFIFTLGLYFLGWSLFEFFYQKKYSFGDSFLLILKSSFEELSPSYWWDC